MFVTGDLQKELDFYNQVRSRKMNEIEADIKYLEMLLEQRSNELILLRRKKEEMDCFYDIKSNESPSTDK
ncbi:hypothetical protein ECANGB1_788 [Enterospora canceri]|uniref:Uncharacterized protein n=1 Tax=Enterospora canceri TaxID=1081671 RepID=A0A1Y1S7D1_9MICR|nr:hypothetical protein ECANGB1_788 [Enterospora canceri]